MTPEQYREAVDAVLVAMHRPREELFEYPYNESESKAIIQRAEAAVDRILGVMKK